MVQKKGAHHSSKLESMCISGAKDVLIFHAFIIVLRCTTRARIAGFSGPSSSYHGAGKSSRGTWKQWNPKAPQPQSAAVTEHGHHRMKHCEIKLQPRAYRFCYKASQHATERHCYRACLSSGPRSERASPIALSATATVHGCLGLE